MNEIIDTQARKDIAVLSNSLQNHIKGCEEGNARMEKKLDSIAEAITANEVRSKDRSSALFNKFDGMDSRLRQVEQSPKDDIINRVKIWVYGGLVTGLAALVGYLLKYGSPWAG